MLLQNIYKYYNIIFFFFFFFFFWLIFTNILFSKLNFKNFAKLRETSFFNYHKQIKTNQN